MTLRLAIFINYLKTAARSLLRDRFYSAFNIAGLAIGMACCLLVALFVIDEYRYDRHQPLSERTYRIVSPEGGVMPAPLGPMLSGLPEIEKVVRIHTGFKPMLVYGNRRSLEQVHFVDGDFPEVFDIEFIYGDPATALDGYRKMVLSEETALRLFGDRDPRGEIISWDERFDYEVSGVAKALTYSHFSFEILGSMRSMADDQFWNTHTVWAKEFRWFYRYTYIVLNENVDPELVAQKAYDLVGQTRGREDQLMVENWGGFFLQALRDIHLHSHYPRELGTNGHIEHIYIAIAVAALVLLIACINYINLAVARGARREREVGIRKAIGAHRRQLITQLLGESILTCVFGLIVGLTVAQLTLPFFNAFFDKETSLLIRDGLPLITALAAAILTGLLAGFYPAFIISAKAPGHALKNKNRVSGQRWLRQGLVGFQFAISIALIATAGIIADQLRYIENKDLGYNTDRILLAHIALPSLNGKMPTLHAALSSHPGIEGAVSFWNPPSGTNGRLLSSTQVRRADDTHQTEMLWNNTSPGFFEFFGMGLIAGREFSSEIESDHRDALIINESALPLLGFTSAAEAIGQPVKYQPQNAYGSEKATIIGVMRDVHFESLYEPIRPMAFSYTTGDFAFGSTGIRLRGGQVKGALAFLKETWAQVIPDFPMDYHFLDEDFQAVYESEKRLGHMLAGLAGLAAFLACIGALALALFTSERRTREFGVRKVLGASDGHIAGLLLTSFTWPVLAALCVAWPAAYFAASNWLENFTYRTALNPLTFIASTLAVLLVVWATVGYQALRAARANPIDALRSE